MPRRGDCSICALKFCTHRAATHFVAEIGWGARPTRRATMVRWRVIVRIRPAAFRVVGEMRQPSGRHVRRPLGQCPPGDQQRRQSRTQSEWPTFRSDGEQIGLYVPNRHAREQYPV